MRLFPLLLVCLSVATASAQQVIYVDHSSTNSTQNGNAWATAYHELRDAMVDARVSAGTASSPV